MDPDFSDPDPSFLPIWIRTQEKKSPIRIRETLCFYKRRAGGVGLAEGREELMRVEAGVQEKERISADLSLALKRNWQL